DRTMDLAVHGAATLAAAYVRVSDRAGVVVLGGALRWLGPAHGDRQFYQIAELLLQARYDSWVTPDLDRIPRTALPPGTLAVIFSPLLDPRGLAALTDLRRRGFPLIVVDTLRDEPPPVARPADAGLALLTVAWPLAWAPAWTYPVAGLGAVAALTAPRWRRGPVLAVGAGVVSCAVSTAGAAVLTIEGLFILCYLVAADAPPGRPAQ